MQRIVGTASALISRGGKPLRFLVVGGLNTALGVSIYPILLWTTPILRVHYFAALLLAQAMGTMFAYCTYKLLVFQTKGRNARELVRFLAFYLANYALNWAMLPLLVEVVRLPPAIAQLGFTFTLVLASWFWHRRVTFAVPTGEAVPPPARDGLPGQA